MKENEFSVKLGGNTLFTVSRNEGGYLAIDFEVYDASRHKIASVKKNKIYPHKDHKANYALEGAAGTADTLALIVSTFLPNGDHLLLGPDSSNIKGNQFTGCTFKNSTVGILIS